METFQFVKTGDNSSTLFSNRFNEHYHSTFGAIQESKHVFIEAGLDHLAPPGKNIHVLEIGFGSGLNALLTFLWSKRNKTVVDYTAVEAYPISIKVAAKLNYPSLLDVDSDYFAKLHSANAEKIILSDYFFFNLLIGKFEEIHLPESEFDLVFFDAFSPVTQPELWTEFIFSKLYKALKKDGILTTYSTKGIVKRALKSSGFSIEKLPGPPGKREILRALKI